MLDRRPMPAIEMTHNWSHKVKHIQTTSVQSEKVNVGLLEPPFVGLLEPGSIIILLE